MLLGIAIWAFRWAVKSKQFDDLDRSANEFLFDDDEELHRRAIAKDRQRDIQDD